VVYLSEDGFIIDINLPLLVAMPYLWAYELSAEYYYIEWVKRYTAQIQDNVFTPEYSRKNETD